MGMIREIEIQINRKFGGEKDDKTTTRPHTKNNKFKLNEYQDGTVSRNQEEMTIVRSSRRLELAIEAYNKDH